MENKTTQKLLALFLLMALVLAFGCAKAATKAPAGRVQVQAPTAPISTANAVSDVESDMAEIDALDKELTNTDLDGLDTELDIQI